LIKTNDEKFNYKFRRSQTLSLFNLQLSEDEKIEDPTKFIKFPWEEETIEVTEMPDFNELAEKYKG
jgi:hypothetical protein